MTTVESETDSPHIALRGLPDETILQRQVRYAIAIFSVAAGILHILAGVAYGGHHELLGASFYGVAAFQMVWAYLLIRMPSKAVVALGAVATVAFGVVWAVSRTKGVGFWDELSHVEPIEWRDTVAQWFQVLIAVGSVIILLPKRVHQPATGTPVESGVVAFIALLSILTVGIVYTATRDYSHHEDGGDPNVEAGTTDHHAAEPAEEHGH